MKWFIIVLLAAGALIALGVVATGSRQGEIVSSDPHAAELCKEGTEDMHAFRLRSAVGKLSTALELDPELAEAAISRAMAYARLGEIENFKHDVARADSLTAAIGAEKRRLLAQLRLSAFESSTYRSLRDSIMKRVRDDDPDNIYVLVAEATEAAISNDDQAIETSWQRILDKDPNYANSYNMLGYLELNRGHYEQAIEYMQKYAFLAPDLANPHDSMGEVLMVLGRYEEAEAEFRNAVTMQPDFYHSLINLGKTYLARGQLRTGLSILDKVRKQVTGSEIEKRVDREIIHTYLVSGLNNELGRAAVDYVNRYPDDEMAGMYRAVTLAYMDHLSDSRAVMDSCLARWREDSSYEAYDKVRNGIDSAAHQFDGIVADLIGDHQGAVAAWSEAIATREGEIPLHEQRYSRYRLAASLRRAGRPAEALEIVDKILAVNPRVIIALELKVRCHLDLNQGPEAAQAVEHLQWSLSKADEDFPVRATAAELAARVSSMAGGTP